MGNKDKKFLDEELLEVVRLQKKKLREVEKELGEDDLSYKKLIKERYTKGSKDGS